MASRSINRVVLAGNLTRDPDLKHTVNGHTVCVFGLATNRLIGASEGDGREETQFHRIVAWDKLGDLAARMLTKGRRVYIEGRLVYRTYTDAEAQTHGVCEIVADDFILLDSKPVASSDDAAMTSSDEEPPIAGQPVEVIDPDELPF